MKGEVLILQKTLLFFKEFIIYKPFIVEYIKGLCLNKSNENARVISKISSRLPNSTLKSYPGTIRASFFSRVPADRNKNAGFSHNISCGIMVCFIYVLRQSIQFWHNYGILRGKF